MPTSPATTATAALSGGSNRATALSLNFCPYRAIPILCRRPLLRFYWGDNYSDAGGAGGDMIWVNMVDAYNNLPDDIKAQIADLRARHSIEASFGAAMPIEKRLALKEQYPDPEHPVVRTHPETGDKILFVNAFTTHFTNYHTPQRVRYGQDANPGAGLLLHYLISQAYIPEYQVRRPLNTNTVAIWDNRCTQHYAVQDYWPDVRRLERAGIIGDRPY